MSTPAVKISTRAIRLVAEQEARAAMVSYLDNLFVVQEEDLPSLLFEAEEYIAERIRASAEKAARKAVLGVLAEYDRDGILEAIKKAATGPTVATAKSEPVTYLQ